MKKILFISIIIVTALFISGCPSTKESTKEKTTVPPPPAVKKPPAPELSVTVASINLAKLSRRVERKDVELLVNILRKEKVDVLTLQSVSRYPDVTTRIDIPDELARDAEMRSVFGETITLSGKQNGNTIFSMYPILSSENTHYDGITSTNFESALQAVIDCGSRDIVFVSTNLPERASLEDQTTCINRLSSFNVLYINHPLIITGNMPKSDAMRNVVAFDGTKATHEEDAPRMWFSNDGSLKLLHESVGHTPLGPMMIVQFGIFRKQ
jgi:endonuclease/exonuclease/phosphatase family metal-dependent hydrolase